MCFDPRHIVLVQIPLYFCSGFFFSFMISFISFVFVQWFFFSFMISFISFVFVQCFFFHLWFHLFPLYLCSVCFHFFIFFIFVLTGALGDMEFFTSHETTVSLSRLLSCLKCQQMLELLFSSSACSVVRVSQTYRVFKWLTDLCLAVINWKLPEFIFSILIGLAIIWSY